MVLLRRESGKARTGRLCGVLGFILGYASDFEASLKSGWPSLPLTPVLLSKGLPVLYDSTNWHWEDTSSVVHQAVEAEGNRKSP